MIFIEIDEYDECNENDDYDEEKVSITEVYKKCKEI